MPALLLVLLAQQPAPAVAPTPAPELASFEEDGGPADLTMVCDAAVGDRVRCRFVRASVEALKGVCTFKTQHFEVELRRGAAGWSSQHDNACGQTVTVTLSSGPAGWVFTQVLSGTSTDSEFCQAAQAKTSVRFVPGGGRRRALRCESVAVSLG